MARLLWDAFALFFLLGTVCHGQENFRKLPYCENLKSEGLVLVSTLDGQVSALSTNGSLLWSLETKPGPLLVSNIHNLEFTNSGEWVRIIPSLTGSLYKFDGKTIDAIPLSVDSLLKSSTLYSDDLVMAGGKEVSTHGVALRSGDHLYECSLHGCTEHAQASYSSDDVIVIERKSQTVRAIEPRTGSERWNFSVGLHSIKIPHISCIDPDMKPINLNITAVPPEGLVIVKRVNSQQLLFQHKFDSPIVEVWHWNGLELIDIDIFDPATDNSILPSIYLGMYQRQLYVYESITLRKSLQLFYRSSGSFEDSQSIAQIPWKPKAATSLSIIPVEDDGLTARSVLYSSEYINGNGYYLYSKQGSDKEDNVCNVTINSTAQSHSEETPFSLWDLWDDIILLVAMTIVTYKIVTNVPYLSLLSPKSPQLGEKVSNQLLELKIETPQPIHFPERTNSESLDTVPFTSRYLLDFEPVCCLGKGGFGVVFKARKKFDDCYYAIKRITLPDEPKGKERMMREVKALAKLDHRNIVRYYNAWLEHPPPDWKYEHDQSWMSESSSSYSVSAARSSVSRRSYSVSADSSNNSFIVFKSQSSDDKTKSGSDSIVFISDSESSATSKATVVSEVSTVASSGSGLDHWCKKAMWRSRNRKAYSLDITSNGSVAIQAKPFTFLYIQMQLCRQDSLQDWLRTNAKRHPDDVTSIFKQTLEAVEYVHLQNLIHRDLKPSNIFFSLEGQIKIGDFGLATDNLKDALTAEATANRTHHLGRTREVGTKLYMSPEQAKGIKYSNKVDIYSLGIIYFELLTRFVTEMERICVLTALRQNRYPERFLETHSHEYQLLRCMLAEDPVERPSATNILAALPQETGHYIKSH